MKSLGRLRPSPAMVVACIALTVALGGTSYAAINLPKNSVGTKQLKKNAVTAAKVKANAITSPKVANNSLTGADVNEATLGTVPSATNATTAGTAAPSGAAGGSLSWNLSGSVPCRERCHVRRGDRMPLRPRAPKGRHRCSLDDRQLRSPEHRRGGLRLRLGSRPGSREQRRADHPSG